ncbi:short-chain dehydrogenase/reductase SDR [Anopheles sinensis]|uniref:Short-chain dehydrogenase/reductase SDR n=1 Tax=Anopheles sinensis TaxID=74873 RepID=A0A084VBQ9_ANOSI|nr:short-chain dehydrogenase/reductase SDR [Anopheles sinensis]
MQQGRDSKRVYIQSNALFPFRSYGGIVLMRQVRPSGGSDSMRAAIRGSGSGEDIMIAPDSCFYSRSIASFTTCPRCADLGGSPGFEGCPSATSGVDGFGWYSRIRFLTPSDNAASDET